MRAYKNKNQKQFPTKESRITVPMRTIFFSQQIRILLSQVLTHQYYVWNILFNDGLGLSSKTNRNHSFQCYSVLGASRNCDQPSYNRAVEWNRNHPQHISFYGGNSFNMNDGLHMNMNDGPFIKDYGQYSNGLPIHV